MSMTKTINCYRKIFSVNRFFDETFFDHFLILLKPKKTLNNELVNRTQKREPKTKKGWPDVIFANIVSFIF